MDEETLPVEQNANLPALTTEQNMIAVIAKLASDPATNIDKIERLLEVQIKMMDRQAKMDFDQALARVQSKMPRIEQNGFIRNRAGEITSRYMKYEDIDYVIRPLLQEEDLSLIHTRDDKDGKMIVTTILKHRSGHQESVSMPLPYDKENALKSAVQAAVSTFSYGKRVNVCSLLNIVAEGEDNDGQQAHIPIDKGQVDLIRASLKRVGATEESFLSYMGVSKIEDIKMRDYGKASIALRSIPGAAAKKEGE